MSEPEDLDPRQLRPGPIRHESLPPELLERIEAVFAVLGLYLGMSGIPESLRSGLAQTDMVEGALAGIL